MLKMRHTASLLIPTVVAVSMVATGVRASDEKRREEVPPMKAVVKKLTNHNAEEGFYNAADAYLKRGPRDERTLVLTFDDGPHPESANRLLDILRELDVKATFFVVGRRVAAHPEIVKRMIAEGHEVANHTQDHTRLFDLSTEKVIGEIKDCEENVRKATGRGMVFLRPPGMHFTPQVLAETKAQGYITVGVNCVAGDYVANGGLAELTPDEAEQMGLQPHQIANRIERQFKPGAIILLHDNPVSIEAVADIVARARTQGYRFVTTAELMASLPEPVRVVANPVEGNREEEKGKK
jgi:peptidoglycan/xylan/chitin deacetylase (PgdA/CDA1 family)